MEDHPELIVADEEPLDWLRRTPLLRAFERRRDLESEEKRAMGQRRDPAREERQYRHPNFHHGGQLWLVRCFACSEHSTENHVSLIPTGVCATCGWEEGDPIYTSEERGQSHV